MARIALAGSTGMLGTVLVSNLEAAGHEVIKLVRHKNLVPGEIFWSPSTGQLDETSLEGCDAAINLAGESISQRWTGSTRKQILDSRVLSTRLVARACIRAKIPVLINASATGIYGNRQDEILEESSPCGAGFLADTCVAWERALDTAHDAGIRTTICRFGVILARYGGAFSKMLPAFKAGLGGPLGTGKQWMPWIHILDAVRAIENAVFDPVFSGPLLVTSPVPSRQEEFARRLSEKCQRKVRMKTPAWVLRLAMGAMADELLLSSQRCRPTVLESTGFVWAFPNLKMAIDDLMDDGRLKNRI